MNTPSNNTPSDRGWAEIRISIVLSVLATVAVALRFIARLRKRQKLFLDDWFALAGLVWIGAMLIEEVLWATIGGSGKHLQDLPLPQIENFFKIFLANMFTYSITSPIIKLSLIIFYRRIFVTKGFKMMADALITLCILWGAATFFASALQCRPLKAFWDITIQGQCFDSLKFVLGVQGVNIFLDVAILCLPMKMVFGLRRPWQERLALSGVFLLGGFVVFASIYRIVTLLMIQNEDISYTSYHGAVWTFVEPCIGLVCSCLPTIRSLFPAYKVGSTKKASSGSAPLKNSNQMNSYNSRLQYAKMDSFSHDIRGTDSENDELESPGKINIKTTVSVV